MKRLGKLFALLLVITTLVWLTTLWRWQSAAIDPAMNDVVLHLAIVPLVLTASLALVLVGMASLKRYALAPVSSPSVVRPGPQADPGPFTTTRSAEARILASAARMRAGDTWKHMHAAIEAGDLKPTLDAELKDDAGLPVFTARVDDLDDDAITEALEAAKQAVMAKDPSRWADTEIAAEVSRAVSLLAPCLDDMWAALDAQWPSLAACQMRAETRPHVGPNGGRVMTLVTLHLALPSAWPATIRDVVEHWLRQQLGTVSQGLAQALLQAGAKAPAEDLIRCTVHAAAQAEDVWLTIDQHVAAWHQRSAPEGLVVVAACDSFIGERTVNRLHSERALFSSSHQRGIVPGEGAAAMLLAPADWPASTLDEGKTLTLRTASRVDRDKSADDSGRIGAHALTTAVQDALRAAGCEPRAVQSIVSDLDHRGSRAVEVHETLQAVLPDLDPSVGLLRLGVACGDIGIARLLALTHLACERAAAEVHPVLAIGAAPRFARFALVVAAAASPPPLPSDAPASVA